MENKNKITDLGQLYNYHFDNSKRWLNWAIVFAIVAVAFFIRFHNIEITPAGIYPDEAVNGIDAINVNETGIHKFFYTNNYGREGLFMNLISYAIKIFGNTILGLRIWSVIFGTLTVLGIFLLTKELFRSYRSGLVAAYFLTFSFWAINFSRISFRAIMLPFVLTFSFYFLFKALHTKKYIFFALAGAFFGLGIHTYIAFRVAPLILVILLAALLATHKKFLCEHWKYLIVFLLFAFIVAFPLILDFFHNPDHFSSRTGAVSIFSPSVNQGHFFTTLGKSLGLSLAKYNFWGDQNWRHNYPPYSVLDPITGIGFLIGIIYIVAKILHLGYLRFHHKIRDEKLTIYIFLVGWLVTMLMPEFMTAEGLPHALRSIGTIPAVIIIATIPILWILGKSDKFSHFFKISTFSLLVIAFVFIGLFNTVKYFVFWANNREQHGAFNENLKNMALYLNNLPSHINKYVVPNGSGKIMEDGLPVSNEVIKYLTYKKSDPEFLTPNSIIKTPMVILMTKYDQNIIDRVRLKFPQAETKKIDPNPGYWMDFSVIEIK
jgi:4-amino-4-deoxy-L-arabinose transferase-like glycosyltransferase